MKLKIFFQNHSKVFIFDLEFEFRDLILMEKNAPLSLSMFIATSELCGFGIGCGIGRKYRPITVSVSVSGRNQNGGFRSFTSLFSLLISVRSRCMLWL